MKKTIFLSLFFCGLPVIGFARTTNCSPLFPIIDALITPLPVGDETTYALTVPLKEMQKEITDKAQEYREAMEAYRDKLGTNISSSGNTAFRLSEIKSPEKGTDTGIDVYKGTADPEGKKGAVVDFTNPDSIQKALDDFVLVSNVSSPAEEQMAKDIKMSFLQQSSAEMLAKVLYYKHELNELKKMEEEITSASADETTAGVISLSNRVTELKNRVKIFQQKVASLMLDLETFPAIRSQEFLSTKIQE